MKVIFLGVGDASSGINLPEANHVFFMHPIFEKNP